ncbi:hypothetical protein AVEN_209403-1 [Araneus ventricosus]|uniref:Uncharacterized protein n=1 Tax=Araneus ventricosus TaxID=182803 RepID=A0A4Y2JNS1_ARAVE|nr:hypothetical protein AVEN_209403-1 [Araneus ventricosus]
MVWAQGKGVKGKEYKDYWQINAGVSLIPYEKIHSDLEALEFQEEGGFIHEESLPEHPKALIGFQIMGFSENGSTIKITTVDPAITSTTGDETPTEADGTNVSSPSAVVSTSAISTQTGIPVTNTNRLPVQPPVSTSGRPIPYLPLQNVGFNFSPPGMRPPGMAPNSQFPWMQKPPGSFTDFDSIKSRSAPGMPPHMFNNRLPFHEVPSGTTGHATPTEDSDRLPVPPPVSTSGRPIPYSPPQNIGFNFPSPGMRHLAWHPTPSSPGYRNHLVLKLTS